MAESSVARCTSRARLRVGEPVAPHLVTASPASAAIQGFHWTAALQQTPATPSDSVRVESPLPGGIAEVTRFLLNTVPSWLQIAGLGMSAICLFIIGA